MAQHLAHDREQPGRERREHAEPREHDARGAADLAGDSGAHGLEDALDQGGRRDPRAVLHELDHAEGGVRALHERARPR